MSKTEPLRFAEVLPLKRVANLNMPLSHTSIMEMHGLEMHFSGRCPDTLDDFGVPHFKKRWMIMLDTTKLE